MKDVTLASSPSSGKLPYRKQFFIFLKIKAIKIFLKVAILLGLIWAFSGTWIGEKLKLFIRIFSSGFLQVLQKVFFYTKIAGEASLLIILVLVVMGKPIWKGFYFIIFLGLAAFVLEHFIF